jgi:hypothetical protein
MLVVTASIPVFKNQIIRSWIKVSLNPKRSVRFFVYLRMTCQIHRLDDVTRYIMMTANREPAGSSETLVRKLLVSHSRRSINFKSNNKVGQDMSVEDII